MPKRKPGTVVTAASNTVVLHGKPVDLNSDEGRRFTADACRAGEGLLDDSTLRDMYGITDDSYWKAITANKALINAIRDERARRVRSGAAAREMAARHFVKAPGVLDEIMMDKNANARHRIDSANALRQTAHGGGDAENAANVGPTFVITINLGDGDVEHYEKPLAPMKSQQTLIEGKADADEQ